MLELLVLKEVKEGPALSSDEYQKLCDRYDELRDEFINEQLQ